MSWFSELKGKAEAMLVKLDQEAGEALQTENLIKGKLVDQALSSIGVSRHDKDLDSQSDPDEEYITRIMESESTKNSDKPTAQPIPEQLDEQIRGPMDESRPKNLIDVEPEIENDVSRIELTTQQPINDVDDTDTKKSTATDGQPYVKSPKIQFYHRSSNKFANIYNKSNILNNHNSPSTSNELSPIGNKYDKDVTKGNIESQKNFNRSEMSIKPGANHTSTSNPSYEPRVHIDSQRSRDYNNGRSRFQPELTNTNSHFDSNYDAVITSPASSLSPSTDRLHQSNSFCIDVPDSQNLFNGPPNSFSKESPNDIAMRLLAHSVQKKKSTFNIHKVINRLSSPTSRSEPIISDQMRIKIRRAQLRLGSYARRLNYHFQTNRMVRYSIYGYFLLMQLLIVYVLFFYQSSPSNSGNRVPDDLTLQVRKQESLKSQMNQWVKEEAGRHL